LAWKLSRIESNTCCGVELEGSFEAALAALKPITVIIVAIGRLKYQLLAFIVPPSNQDR